MTPERWQRIEELYHAAAEVPPDARADWLAAACAGDATLRAEVEVLLAANAEAASFMATPAMEREARALAKETQPLTAGTQLNRYRIIEPLGAGGMGEVYLAEDAALGRKVAVKLLPAPFTADVDRVRRFAQEARAASALNHPNIITIHDIGEAALKDGHSLHFIATEYVEGVTLRRRLQDGRLEAQSALKIALQIAAALAAAHRAGVVHRDIKPENVMLRPDGLVKVLDFGLARVAPPHPSVIESEASTLAGRQTTPGTVLGTPRYMSPEQARGQEADARTDIFSLGVVLYEMLAGAPPFTGATAAEVFAALLEREPEPLAARAPDAPPALEQIVRRALAKDCRARYQTAAELEADLQLLRQESSASRSAARSQPSAQPRAPYVWAGLVLLAVLLLGLAVTRGLWWKAAAPATNGNEPSQTIKSIVVLPLRLLSAQTDEYLGLGMADVLITRLGNLRQLTVRPTSAVMRYKDQPPDALAAGREQRVDAVLEGSIHLQKERLRLTVRLIAVRDGAPLWSAQFDEPAGDLFKLQDAISQRVAEALALELTGAERASLTKRATENSAAYQEYVKGRYFWNTRSADGLQKAVAHFQQALALDPAYAPAHAGLGDCYVILGSAGYDATPPEVDMPKAKAAATRALELDPTLGAAHATLGFVKAWYDWDWPGAEKEFARAIELQPGYATAHQWQAWYLITLGKHDEAIAAMKRARDLDPLSLIINTNVGTAYYYARRYAEAEREVRRALELDPKFATAHAWLGWIAVAQGRYDEALAEFQQDSYGGDGLWGPAYVHARAGRMAEVRALYQRMQKLARAQYFSGQALGLTAALLGEWDEGFAWFDRALAAHDEEITLFKVDPRADLLRGDPRFKQVLQRLRLAE